MRQISLTTARRLAITCQHLALPSLPDQKQSILRIVRDLGCIQIDPVNIVAPSHQLVLWSRLGPFPLEYLNELSWIDHQLFEDWAHCTSIVPTSDYPIFKTLKREWQIRPKYQDWVTQNQILQRYLMKEIRTQGPLPTNYFEDRAKVNWTSGGWTTGRNVAQMLFYLWMKGKIMVARREGNIRYWDLTKRVLPESTPTTRLTSTAVRIQIAQKALQTLGVAQPSHIRYSYIRGLPEQISPILDKLESKALIERLQIHDPVRKKNLRGSWFIHTKQIPLLDQIENNTWTPKTTFLSPFDNLVYDRKRTEQLFSFRYRLEIYVPKDKRQFGPYTLPILHGDRFIGRLDVKMHRETKELEIKKIYPEPNEPQSHEIGDGVTKAINELAVFLEAKTVMYSTKFPKEWGC